MIERSCCTCEAWEPGTSVDELPDECGESIGICHRFPPKFTLDEEAAGTPLDDDDEWIGRQAHLFIFWAQPRVVSTNWCMEWRPAPKEK